MEKLGIATAMLSISSPGVHFGDDRAARDLARRVNEEGARLRHTYPDRFGWFATTSLPDVESATTEAVHALDQLAADGIVVESNHHGLYLGDSKLHPFYEVLNERESVLFIHPSSPSCAGCDALSLGYPKPMLEFMFETTRTVASMILSGVTLRYPKMKIIVPHAGAALSALASRVDLLMPYFEANSPNKSPKMRTEMRKLYYDLAGAPLPELLSALLSLADPDRIMYGSDWPFTQVKPCLELAQTLDASPVLQNGLRQKFMLDNSLALFPRLRSERSLSQSNNT
jgi:predicted TIM-barrel fold metal-dependent hydrolase